MIDWGAVTGVVAALAVAVTLVLFVFDSRRRARDEQTRLKQEAISRILTTMEVSIRRNQGILSSLRFWSNPDLEYALAIPRLLHDLGPSNRHVANWVFGETQSMLVASSDKKASEIGIRMCYQLVEWGQGSVTDDWFNSASESSPVDPSFRAQQPRLRRSLNRLRSSFGALSALSVMAGALFKIGQIVWKL